MLWLTQQGISHDQVAIITSLSIGLGTRKVRKLTNGCQDLSSVAHCVNQCKYWPTVKLAPAQTRWCSKQVTMDMFEAMCWKSEVLADVNLNCSWKNIKFSTDSPQQKQIYHGMACCQLVIPSLHAWLLKSTQNGLLALTHLRRSKEMFMKK
jgi:hypothetical protein